MKHIYHINELPLVEGLPGLHQAITHFDNLFCNVWPLRPQISLKIDGRIAIIAGPHPDSGKFFLATKSLFNKQPQYYTARKQIGERERNVDKYRWLLAAWDVLSRCSFSSILGGDLLFTADSKDGNSFHPNILRYGCQTSLDKYSIGVAWHTAFSGSLESLVGSPPDFESYVIDPRGELYSFFCHDAVNTSYKIDDSVAAWYESKRDYLHVVASEIDKDIWDRSTQFGPLIIRALNAVRRGAAQNPLDWIFDPLTVSARLLADVPPVRDLMRFLYINDVLAEIKMKALGILERQTYGNALVPAPYLVQADGCILPTAHEGFVLTCRQSRHQTKLVDQNTFSTINFQPNNYQRGFALASCGKTTDYSVRPTEERNELH